MQNFLRLLAASILTRTREANAVAVEGGERVGRRGSHRARAVVHVPLVVDRIQRELRLCELVVVQHGLRAMGERDGGGHTNRVFADA